MKLPKAFLLLMTCRLLAIAVQAENTATNPVPRTFPTDWMSRHESFLAEARRGKIELLFIGDSITDGWRWQKGGLKLWNEKYAPRHAADFGIGYDRTQNVLWRLRHGELDGLDPKEIVLLIGTNNLGNEDDGKPRNSPDEAAAGVMAVVNEIRTRLPRSKLLLFGIFPRGNPGDPVRVQVKAVNAQLARLDDGKSVKFLDLGDKFLSPDGTLSRDVFPDLLHPNEKGYEIWCNAIEAALAGWKN